MRFVVNDNLFYVFWPKAPSPIRFFSSISLPSNIVVSFHFVSFPLQESAISLYTMAMNKETFIFIGASGCGKGTQVSLLKERLVEKTPDTPIFYMQTGQYFREFVEGDSHASQIRERIEKGERAPDFLAMYLWSDIL